MTPEASTLRTKTSPYAARLATPSWIRAPPESLSPISGTPLSIARSLMRLILFACTRDIDPPRTVKSCAKTATRRPLILPKPATMPSPGNRWRPEAERGLLVGRERAHLLERAVVEQQREALPGRQLAARVLGRDPLGPTTLERPRAHGPQGVEMLGHAGQCAPGRGVRPTADRPRQRPATGADRPGLPGDQEGSEAPPPRRRAPLAPLTDR